MTEKDYEWYVDALEKLVSKQGWSLIAHYRKKNWCSFTRPEKNRVAFGIWFPSENRLYLYIKRVHAEAETFPISAANYNEGDHQDEYLLEPGITKLEDFLPLLKLGYSRC